MKRRDMLIGTKATIGVIAFDPVKKLWITDVKAQSTSSIAIPHLDGQILLDPESLAAVADDFGHIIKQTPVAVLQPGSKKDIEKIIRYANRFGIKVAMRGQGHTTYGQAQVDTGVIIDSKTLNKIHSISSTKVVVESGVLILDLLKATLAQGLTPKVFPDYLGLSVGGLLQVGGIGGHTQKFGLFADNVLEVQAILGSCMSTISSPSKNPGLFNSIIGGLGQFGIITQTTLPLIEAPTHARVYQLSYTNLQQYIADQNQVVKDGRFSYLEGQVVANPSATGWTYLLEAASYYTPPQTPSDSLLDDLSPDNGTKVDEFSYFDWQNRLATVVAGLQESGAWEFPHPWLDLFIPNSKVKSYIHQVLQNLKPTDVNGPILLYPFVRRKLTHPFIKVPSEEIIYLFSILRTAPPDDPSIVQAMVAANRSLFEQARNQGGKSYRISAFPFSPQDWIEHFDQTWNRFRRQKASLDPNNILTPGQGIFNTSYTT